nr:potassium channel protein [candidate division Zixibacteria bacterium]
MQEKIITPTRKLAISIIIMLILIVGGTMGFATIENMSIMNSLYMTVITISTVGFGEVQTLHPGGRMFVIMLIVFSIVAGTIAASAIGQFIVEGEIRQIMGRRIMRTKIQKLSDHYIIAGFGRVGRHVTEAYLRRQVSFIVIERDNAALNQLDAEGILYVEGQATEDETLRTAGVEKARVLVSTLPDEADNVYLALTARHLNPNLHIICRADNPEGEKKLKIAGANYVVSPHVMGGMRMAMASLRPNVVDFMQMTALGKSGLGIEEVKVPEGSWLNGKSLIDSQVKAKYGITVIGIKKKSLDLVINPSPNAIMDSGDILVLVGSSDELENFTAEMG